MAFSLVGEETSFCRACGVDKAPRTGSYGHCNCLVLGFYCQNYQTVICVSGSFLIVCTYIRRRQWHPTPVLLPGKSHGRRSLVGCSPWGCEESDRTERLHFHFSLSCIGEGNGNPLQCSCLENPWDGRAWWAAIYGVAQSRTRLKRLSSSSSSRTCITSCITCITSYITCITPCITCITPWKMPS